MKEMLSGSKDLIMEVFSMKEEKGTLQKLGGLRHEKSTR